MSPDRQQCMQVESFAAVDNVGIRGFAAKLTLSGVILSQSYTAIPFKKHNDKFAITDLLNEAMNSFLLLCK